MSTPDTRGIAFIEVPDPADRLHMAAPDGVEVRWLPRGTGVAHGKVAHGEVLIPAVLDYLGTRAQGETGPVPIKDVEIEDLLWETPEFSSLGEAITPSGSGASGPSERGEHDGHYFWIAGESAVVTTLRRHLVRDLGIDRTQVAFMGYWRTGVAMRG